MSVTLRDVAARANVSPIVVSHVLHKKANTIRVSEATAERVRTAAREMGYRCNVMARNFRNQQTLMIGVLHGLGFSRPRFNAGNRYFAALMDGIVEGAFKHGYSVTLCPKLLGDSPQEAITDGRFDGLVWYSTQSSENNRRMLETCVAPLVLLHAEAREYDNQFPTVCADNDQGVSLALDHLKSLGHRQIAFAYAKDNPFTETELRWKAFRRHLDRLGLPIDDSTKCGLNSDPKSLGKYLTSGLRHTAIITHSDELAAKILMSSRELGIRVPEDLSVIGFDSTSFCEELRPRLTSISQPLYELGEAAIDQLMLRMAGAPIDPLTVLLPCGLDIRESTGPVLART